MPTLFIAQDGAQVKQSTPIGVTGCPKTKKTKKADKPKKAKKAQKAQKASHAHGNGRTSS